MLHIPKSSVTLWTIQHENAYQTLKQTGVLCANENFLIFESAYRWMAEQMRQKLNEPPEGIRYPMWAWYQWEGKRKRRDLRCSGYASRGTPLVQITFEMEPERMLLSDFDDWHFVLNNWYLSVNQQDEAQFDAEVEALGYQHCDLSDFFIQKKDMLHLRKKIVQSWQHIFDLQEYTPGRNYAPEEKSIQATFWELHMKQVRKVEYFLAK